MMAVEPITREEKLLDAVSAGSPSGIEPITREEMYLAYIGGQDVIPPEPITRKEQLLSMIAPNGGSGGGDDLLDAFLVGSLSGVYENANLTTLKGYAFWGMKNLTRISLPNVVNVGDFAFCGCSNLEELDISNLEYGSKQIFNGCTKLTSIVLPLLKKVSVQFSYGSSIVVADFPTASAVDGGSLSTSSLRTVILRHSAVATLENTTAFNSANVTNGTVKVYVPGSLIESYRTATNWSSLYAQNNNFIQPIEGSEYE